MTNRKPLTTFLFLITNPIHSFYAQSFLFLNYPLRLHPVPRWAPMWSTKYLGTGGLWGIRYLPLSLLTIPVPLGLLPIRTYWSGHRGGWAARTPCTPLLVPSRTMSTWYNWGGVSLRSDRFIFIGRQSPWSWSLTNPIRLLDGIKPRTGQDLVIRTRGTFTWIAAVSLSYGEYLAFNLRVWGLLQRYGRERQLRLMIQILPTPNTAKSDLFWTSFS